MDWLHYALLVWAVIATVLMLLHHRAAMLSAAEYSLIAAAMDALPEEVNIILKDKDFRWVFANNIAAQTCGFRDSADARGKTDADTWASPDQVAIYRQSDQAVLDTRKPVIDAVEPQSRADGMHWLKGNKRLFWHLGKEYLLICWVDITKEYLATREADVRRSVMAQEMAAFSHDTRSAISGIIAMHFMIVKEIKAEGGEACCSPKMENLNRILASAKRLQDLNSGMRQIRALNEAEVKPITPLELFDLIMVDFLKTEAEITWQQEEGYQVMVPPSLFATNVIENIVENAVVYGGDDVKIDVTVSRLPGENFCMFSVTDNGPGIPVESREVVFTMGFGSRLNQDIEGSGIGLYQAKTTVEFLGGKIWIEDPESGSGCRFMFTAPVAPTG